MITTSFECYCGAKIKVHIAEVPKGKSNLSDKCPSCDREFEMKGYISFNNNPVKMTLFLDTE